MPLFEFECNNCNNSFEDLVRDNDEIENVICPFCGNSSNKKKVSTFATKSSLNSGYTSTSSNISASSCSSGSTWGF